MEREGITVANGVSFGGREGFSAELGGLLVPGAHGEVWTVLSARALPVSSAAGACVPGCLGTGR